MVGAEASFKVGVRIGRRPWCNPPANRPQAAQARAGRAAAHGSAPAAESLGLMIAPWPIIREVQWRSCSTCSICRLVDGNIGEAETAAKIAEAAKSKFGSIDALVNNAGIYFSKPFTD